jgi:hypothetical protein
MSLRLAEKSMGLPALLGSGGSLTLFALPGSAERGND